MWKTVIDVTDDGLEQCSSGVACFTVFGAEGGRGVIRIISRSHVGAEQDPMTSFQLVLEHMEEDDKETRDVPPWVLLEYQVGAKR